MDGQAHYYVDDEEVERERGVNFGLSKGRVEGGGVGGKLLLS